MTDLVPAKRLERERNARLEAERLLEEKSRELFLANEGLKNFAESLEEQVAERTQELQQTKDEALKISNAKSRFIAVMSHEVRGPLNGVIGALSLLKDTSVTVEQRGYVEAARTSASALLVIINDILDYSKIDADKLELEPVLFDIHELMTDVISSIRLSSRSFQDSIYLHSQIDKDIPGKLIGDDARVRQVLINLINNALKFTEQGEIEVTSSLDTVVRDRAVIRFGVRDTGLGISPENQEHLFEEFWSQSARGKGSIVGTGLGLPISARLVKLMGGEIGLDSAEGEGSYFWFTVPLSIASESEVRQSEVKLDSEPGQSEQFSGRVLLAEDNSVNQLILSAILNKFGLTVDVVVDGLEAVESVRNRPYDLILMDIDMPGMDGIEATRLIKDSFQMERSKIPIIAITAHALPGDKEKFMVAGFDDYFVKPINRVELRLALERWLRKTNKAGHMGITRPEAIPSEADRSEIDLPTLQKLVREVGKNNLTTLVQVFLEELEKHTDNFKVGVSNGDLRLLGMSAHSLKSSTASFGAMGLSNLAQEIEERVNQDDVGGAASISLEFAEAVEKVRKKLLEIVDNMH
jgi:signal transduction histidine kinase/CheY-like chemotaxis protein/HPt (histidine-containing phosphotransfer) domain-containing protein